MHFPSGPARGWQARLPDADNGLARQMGRLHRFGLHERPPPGRQRSRRRSGAAASAAASSKGLLGLYSSLPSASATETRSRSASTLNLVCSALDWHCSVAETGISRLDPLTCSTSYPDGKLPPRGVVRRITLNDRPYSGCRGSRIWITSTDDVSASPAGIFLKAFGRGDGLAAHGSTAGAAATRAGLTGRGSVTCACRLGPGSIEAEHIAGLGRSALRS